MNVSPEMLGVSVVICCYNSAARLPETFKHLALQKFEKTPVPFEVLMVVDKATTDDTAAVIESFQPQFAPGQLRMVYESKRGLGYARITGAAEARYEYLSFVDDDNWVAADWVETVYQSFSSMPDAAAMGGRGDAVFEDGNEPSWFEKFSGAYAVGAPYTEAGDITDKPTSLLWGAGLCIRKSVFEALMKAGFEFTCTEEYLGKKLFSLVRSRPCEDTELCYGIRAIGGRLYYVPQLYYKHFMASARMTWPVIRKMYREYGRSSVLVTNLRAATDGGMPPMKTKLERSWLFQTARTLKRLFRIALRKPMEMLTPSEGSGTRLDADHLLGKLEMILKIRGRYAALFDDNTARYAKEQAAARR